MYSVDSVPENGPVFPSSSTQGCYAVHAYTQGIVNAPQGKTVIKHRRPLVDRSRHSYCSGRVKFSPCSAFFRRLLLRHTARLASRAFTTGWNKQNAHGNIHTSDRPIIIGFKATNLLHHANPVVLSKPIPQARRWSTG